MRALPRIVVFLVASLLAFWFTVENATETVRIDLILFSIQAALPIVIFASVLVGMGATLLVGWRAESRRRRALKNASLEARKALRSAAAGPADWTGSADDTSHAEEELV